MPEARLSFTEQAVLEALRLSPSYLPGIEKAIAVYQGTVDGKWEASVYLSEQGLQALQIEQINEKMDSLSQSNFPFAWYRQDELPFMTKISAERQVNIFNELDSLVLMLCLPTIGNSQQHNLLFYFFRKDYGMFGINQSTKVLSSDHKNIIGHLFYNFIHTFISNNHKDEKVFESVVRTNRAVGQSLQELRKEKQILGDRQRETLSEFCRLYLKELSVEHPGKTYSLSKEALHKIMQYEGGLENIKHALKNAVIGLSNLLYFETHIQLDEQHLLFEDVKTVTEEEVQAENRYSRSMLLLDKLELAARKLLSEQKELTSKNVGNCLTVPISAPAISDALKKHRSKIQHLLLSNPDKWPIIRSEFRPLKNILVDNHPLRKVG